jgi:secreted trypsin-like serine protease
MAAMRTRAFVRLLVASMLAFAASVAAAEDRDSGARVIGGTSANPNAWPFMVYVKINLDSQRYDQCGGTLVAKQFVLTAGHCAVDLASKTPIAASQYEVWVGAFHAQQDGERHRVVRVIAHDAFGKSYQLENDIALLELDSPVLDPRLIPVDLEGLPSATREERLEVAPREERNPQAKILGWGRTNPDSTDSLAKTLQEASLPIVSNEICGSVVSAQFPDNGPIDDRRICAGNSSGGVDTCGGDSGGPILAQTDANHWVQVGVTSYGAHQCAQPGEYGVYTRVFAYSDWLRKNLSVAQNDKPPIVVPASPITSATTLMAAAKHNGGHVKVEVLPSASYRAGQIGQVRVTSDINGYLLLYDLDEQGKLTQLFPNDYGAGAYVDGKITAGRPLTVPGDSTFGFQLVVSLTQPAPPAPPHNQERNHIIAVVAEKKDMFKGLGRSEDGLKEMDSSAMERLEVVMRPQPGGTAGNKWFAGEADYLVTQ